MIDLIHWLDQQWSTISTFFATAPSTMMELVILTASIGYAVSRWYHSGKIDTLQERINLHQERLEFQKEITAKHVEIADPLLDSLPSQLEQAKEAITKSIANLPNDIMGILTATNSTEPEHHFDLALDRALDGGVSLLDVESKVVQIMENTPTYNAILNGIFDVLKILDIPLQAKYLIIQLIDKDKLHQELIALFKKSFDFKVAQKRINEAFHIFIDVTKLKNGLHAIRHAYINGQLSETQLRSKVEATVAQSINGHDLNLAIIEIVQTSLSYGPEHGSQIGDLLKDAILEAANRLDDNNAKIIEDSKA